MAILFAASELESFQLSGFDRVSQVTTAGRFDSDYSRAAIRCSRNAFIRADFTAVAEGWLHFLVYPTDNNSGGQDGQCFRLIDVANDQQVLIFDADNGVWNLEYWNGASFTEITPNISGGAGGTFPEGELVTIDVHWKIDGVSGVWELFINGVSQAVFNGDTTDGDYASISRVELSSGNDIDTTADFFFSEVIVASEETTTWRLSTLDATGAGSNSAWTNDFSSVNGAPLKDPTFIESGVVDQVETFAASNLSVAAAARDVVGLVIGARAREGATGPSELQGAVRSGGTNYFSANLGPKLAYGPFQAIFETNPDTTSAWTPAEIDAVEYGLRSRT